MLRAHDPWPRRIRGFYKCRFRDRLDQKPPLSRAGSRLAILVHQGSDPTQPYPTLVIRDRAPHFCHGFAPMDMLRRYPVPRQDGRSVGSASPDGVDLTRFTSSLAKTAGRIWPSTWGPVPRCFRTRTVPPPEGPLPLGARCEEAGPPWRRDSARADRAHRMCHRKLDQLLENVIPPLGTGVLKDHPARDHVVGNPAEPASGLNAKGVRIFPLSRHPAANILK